ncbi:hypothetical protein HAX54_029613 [Datura stramonium]|uniref:Uncharacterized protein n=1 Tax=Datura stramonium TaxID=4076 RepID=A0ABS8V9L7_DATST|nr:hypothetical protein [Datura stramonium]
MLLLRLSLNKSSNLVLFDPQLLWGTKDEIQSIPPFKWFSLLLVPVSAHSQVPVIVIRLPEPRGLSVETSTNNRRFLMVFPLLTATLSTPPDIWCQIVAPFLISLIIGLAIFVASIVQVREEGWTKEERAERLHSFGYPGEAGPLGKEVEAAWCGDGGSPRVLALVERDGTRQASPYLRVVRAIRSGSNSGDIRLLGQAKDCRLDAPTPPYWPLSYLKKKKREGKISPEYSTRSPFLAAMGSTCEQGKQWEQPKNRGYRIGQKDDPKSEGYPAEGRGRPEATSSRGRSLALADRWLSVSYSEALTKREGKGRRHLSRMRGNSRAVLRGRASRPSISSVYLELNMKSYFLARPVPDKGKTQRLLRNKILALTLS